MICFFMNDLNNIVCMFIKHGYLQHNEYLTSSKLVFLFIPLSLPLIFSFMAASCAASSSVYGQVHGAVCDEPCACVHASCAYYFKQHLSHSGINERLSRGLIQLEILQP